jgi:hypothetical protein
VCVCVCGEIFHFDFYITTGLNVVVRAVVVFAFFGDDEEDSISSYCISQHCSVHTVLYECQL